MKGETSRASNSTTSFMVRRWSRCFPLATYASLRGNPEQLHAKARRTPRYHNTLKHEEDEEGEPKFHQSRSAQRLEKTQTMTSANRNGALSTPSLTSLQLLPVLHGGDAFPPRPWRLCVGTQSSFSPSRRECQETLDVNHEEHEGPEGQNQGLRSGISSCSSCPSW